MSERQACRMVQVSRCVYPYQAKRTMDEPIVQELRQLADRQPRWGCGKMTDYLRNEGHSWNHKRIRRVYRAMAWSYPVSVDTGRLAGSGVRVCRASYRLGER
jgi:putative transposase